MKQNKLQRQQGLNNIETLLNKILRDKLSYYITLNDIKELRVNWELFTDYNGHFYINYPFFELMFKFELSFLNNENGTKDPVSFDWVMKDVVNTIKENEDYIIRHKLKTEFDNYYKIIQNRFSLVKIDGQNLHLRDKNNHMKVLLISHSDNWKVLLEQLASGKKIVD